MSPVYVHILSQYHYLVHRLSSSLPLVFFRASPVDIYNTVLFSLLVAFKAFHIMVSLHALSLS